MLLTPFTVGVTFAWCHVRLFRVGEIYLFCEGTLLRQLQVISIAIVSQLVTCLL